MNKSERNLADLMAVHNGQPIVGNCDWLAWSVRGIDLNLLPSGSVCFRHKGTTYEVKLFDGTATYRHRWVFFEKDHADKVATLLCWPKSKLFDPGSGLLEVANEWLYHGIGWAGVFDLVNFFAPMVRYGYSRLDYAFDFTPNRRQRCIIQMLADSKAYIAGKRNGTAWWSIDSSEGCPAPYRGRKIPHCQTWGHKTTAVKWKVYYKSKELAEPNAWRGFEKPYIVDLWRKAGLDVYNVWRVEVSIHHGNGFEVNECAGIPYDLDRAGMERVARGLLASRFIIRKAEGHTDKTNDRVLPLFENYRLTAVKCRQYDGDRQTDARHALLRRLLAAMDEPEIEVSDRLRVGVAWLANELVEVDKLGMYAKSLLEGEDWQDYMQRKNVL